MPTSFSRAEQCAKGIYYFVKTFFDNTRAVCGRNNRIKLKENTNLKWNKNNVDSSFFFFCGLFKVFSFFPRGHYNTIKCLTQRSRRQITNLKSTIFVKKKYRNGSVKKKCINTRIILLLHG